MQKPIIWIILGLLFMLIGFGYQIDTVSLTVGLIFLIRGIFMILKYENKMAYRAINGLVLIAMSIITYLQISSSSYTESMLLNGGLFVVVVVLGIFIIYRYPRGW